MPLRRLFALLVVCFFGSAGVDVALGQGSTSTVGQLPNGSSLRGVISPVGDSDRFTFRAKIGEGLQLRLVDVDQTAFQPDIRVYRPNGSLLTSSWDGSVAALSFTAPASGTYDVIVSEHGDTDTGAYRLYYTRAPGANEHGPLANGQAVTDEIEVGDLDSYTFDAQQGEGVQLRGIDLTGGDLQPTLYVYRPDGSFLTSSWDHDVAALAFAAPASGVYTLVVADHATSTYAGTGAYAVQYTRAPGANEHGLLPNGASVDEEIGLGDLDSYTFVANQGEGIQLRAVDVTGGLLQPELFVYRPDGTFLTSAWNGDVAGLAFAAPASGVYTLVVADRATSGHTGTGAYTLHHVRAPGASEHGALVNGGAAAETIGLGDLDSYTFVASQGEGIQLRALDVTGGTLQPELFVYRPDGTFLTSSWNGDVTAVAFAAPATGTYTLVVADHATSGYTGVGAYEVQYARAPGAAEHGALPTGGAVLEAIAVGDLDSYTFDAAQGEGIQLRMADLTGSDLQPELFVYRPDGTFHTSAWNHDVATLAFAAPATGTYTVVVGDHATSGYTGAGPYVLHSTRAPGANELGALANGGAITDAIDLGDLDSLTFTVVAGQTVELHMVDLGGTTLDPLVSIYRPNGTFLTSAWGTTDALAVFVAPVGGTYTAVLADHATSGSTGVGPYQVSLAAQ